MKDGDYIIIQKPLKINKDGLPGIVIIATQISKVLKDSVECSKGEIFPFYRIKNLLENGKLDGKVLDSETFDEKRIFDEDIKITD